ncbi:tape measure protein [uncultured Prevotella sp.]|uniref:tape measure protein n=1 Tax=uncultured Prevotella sp. TaxID=159272 RepID=UPI002596AE45|nr:tape measure protein [uncultured Prevotella sp.]
MAKLSFRVEADYEKVQRLRDEITKLKQEIKGVDAIQDPTSFNKLNSKLQQTSKELGTVTGKIAEASAAMETDFKQKIFAASQGVNDFTEKIIAQKGVVRDVAADVKRLGESYRESVKSSPLTSDAKLAEWKAAKKALDEEKASLFALTQEQATARLSVKKLRDEYASLRQEGGGTAETMDMITGKLKQMSGIILGGMGLKELASRVISVRAEFESMETSLKVLLGGNEERLNNIMGQIKEYALASPLNTKDMVGAVQMMTSFGIEAEKSIDYLKAIGDISMGDSGKFNSLALAFSQMSSAGKLMGQDLMQMVNAGFNPLEEISRKTGKSIGELKNEMAKGAITSKMVQDAFISATSAGGKFFGMSSEGAKTLNGQISMLQESFDNMFNEIGSKGEGVIMNAVKAGTYLVENYETIGKVLEKVVIVYGAYRAALVLNMALEKAQAIQRLAAMQGTTVLSLAVDALKAKTAALNATMLANPYVAVLTAIMALVGVMWTMRDTSSAVADVQSKLNDANNEVQKSTSEETRKLDKLCEILETTKKGSARWKAAKDAIISQYGQYDSRLRAEIERTGTLTSSYSRLTEAIRKSVAARQLKQFYDNSSKVVEEKNQGIRHEIYEQLRQKYGAQTTRFLMQKVNEAADGNDKVLKETIYYFKNGKRIATTAEKMLRGSGYSDSTPKGLRGFAESSISARGAESLEQANNMLIKVRQLHRNNKGFSDRVQQFADENGLSKEIVNETLYGIKPTSNNTSNTSGNYNKAVSTAKSSVISARKKLARLKKSSKSTIAQVEEAQKELDTANESYKKLSGSSLESEEKASAKAAKSAESAAKKAQKAREKAAKAAEKAKKAREIAAKNHQKSLNDLDSKKITKSQALVELENQVEQTRIDALQKGSEKTIAAMKLAHKKELEQIDKQKQEYLKKKQDEAEAEFKANPNNKDKTFNRSTVTLSASENAKFDEMLANIKIKHANENKELEVQRLQALYDYLKEYGTVQQQMYAIAKEYDEKIAKEKDENRRKILEKEKASALAKSNTGNIALDIDWGATFGGIGGVLKDIAKDTLKEVEQYMRTAEFKALSPSDKKAYIDLQEKLRKEGVGEATSPFKFSQWAEIEKQTKAYQDSVRNLQEKTKAHTKAIEDLEKAEKLLTNATTDSSRKIAQAAVDAARVKVDTTADDLNNAKEDKNNKQGNLTNSTNKAIQGLNNFSSALQQMSNGTLKGFADGIANLISSIAGKGGVGGLIGTIGGKAGGLIGAILQIIDALGDDPAGFIKGILDKVAKVVETVLQQIPRIVLDVIKGVGNIIGGIISGISSWFAGGGNEKEMEKEISKLTKANEKLAQTIEDLSKNIGKKDNTNKQSIESYKKAKAAEDEWEANQRRAIDARASEWTNKGYGFLGIGGKGSFNAHSKSRDWWGWNEFNKRLSELGSKAKVFSSTDMWKLSPNEMKTLQETADTAWREFFDNGGHKSPEDLVKEYIERSGKKEELVSALNEKLTGQSWDGFMDSYKSVLKNLESTTEDFANNINELISNALLESFSNEELKPKIKELYEYIAKAAEDGLDDSEIAYIRKKNDEIAALGLKKRSELEHAGLIKKKDSEQNASANGVSSITFEQASNIIALTTAGNISRDQIKDLISTKISTIDITVRGMQSLMGEQRNIADEIRTHQVNSYIELQGIHDDTSAMNKTLKMLSSDVSDIKKNIKDM